MKVEIKFETPERMCVEPVKNMINFIGEKVVYHLEGTKYSATLVDNDNKVIELSAVDIEKENLQKWGKILPFYQNVQKEGIVLWKAA